MGIVILTVSGIVNATMIIPVADQAKEKAKAPEKSPVIGESWDLERVDFIHFAKPSNPGKLPKAETCYKLMGVKWADASLPVSYVINPKNPHNLDDNFIKSSLSASAETWDAVTSKNLFNDIYSIDYNVGYGIQDYKNTIDFADYSDANVIAVTSVWYTRVGKKIVEFDVRFNTDFIWGDGEVDPSLMDLKNIATHELGHAVGLSDIYSDSCSFVTMFGYSSEGDYGKRSLEQPDITGLQLMYGI